MNSRLQQFLELENLSPARLADTLGVQRSGLSHILSGRNKPGYDFINKLLSKFPAISADWLLTGKGKPYKEMNNFSSPPSSPGIENKVDEKTLTNQPLNNISYSSQQLNRQQIPHQQYPSQQYSNQPILSKSEIKANSIDEYEEDTLFSSKNLNESDIAKTLLSADNKSINSLHGTSQLNENQINANKQDSIRKKRSVKRVIIFYSDGSFEELFP